MTRSIYKKSLKRKGRLSKFRGRDRGRSRGRKTRRIVYRRRNINPINKGRRRRIMMGGVDGEYGYVIFGSDGYTLTPSFLRCFDLTYTGTERIEIPYSFVSAWIDIKKNRRDGFLNGVFPTNDHRLKLIKSTNSIEPWELRWGENKLMGLTTIIERRRYGDLTTTVKIKKIDDDSLCLSVTIPTYSASVFENVKFLCKDNTTYPMLTFEDGTNESTQSMSDLINWGDNVDNQCFRSLSMFGMFILLFTIVNAKTMDKNWKKIYKSDGSGRRMYGFKNLKDEFPIHLLPRYDIKTEQEEAPPPSQPSESVQQLRDRLEERRRYLFSGRGMTHPNAPPE